VAQWTHETRCSQGCLSRRDPPELLPLIDGDLYEKSEGHWNATVLGLAQNVLKMYHDSDMATYQDCQVCRDPISLLCLTVKNKK
jgi:serine/threonine-protein phosphatase 2A regulatory subunit B'